MKFRSVVFVFVMLGIGGGQAVAQAAKLNSNAGTGPYLFGPLTGATALTDTNNNIYHQFAEISKWIDARDPTNALVAVNALDILVRGGFKGLASSKEYLELVNGLQAAVRSPNLLGAGNQFRALKTVVQKAEVGVGTAMIKTGVFLRSDSTSQFNSYLVSRGESGAQYHKVDTFFSGAVIFPLRSQSGEPTARIGLGTAFGDPEHSVGMISAGTYLSPGAFDVSASMSLSLIKSDPSEQYVSVRNVLDHIRPGDVWFTVSGHQITGSTSNLVLPNGSIGEAELTFALNKKVNNTISATTFSLSGIYCANKNLGIDELGADLRTPLSTGNFPVFLSARYGTRGHYTLSLNWKL